ncbi:MAG: TonB-dependent receptor [Caulobacteraceae bacterium]|nr:TonB-dependent receptor [Caulobacteraceae bacterium]
MAKRSARGRPWLAGVALLPLAWGAAATGQTAPAAPSSSAPNPTSPGATEVGEIIVTATRQSQNLSKVALSVSAFTAAKMDVQGIKSFADIAKFTPGVTFDEDSHDISIRGINSTAGSGTTGIYIDDTPIQARALGLNANNTLPAVFDLERVEVLRGPQGTLFGAGSEGGTVRYITPQPSLTRYSGYAHSELAFTQDGAPSAEFGVAGGGPIVEDKLGFRASAWIRRDGGWIDRVDYRTGDVTDADANRVDTYVLRAALAWRPTPNLTITPGIDYQKRDQHNYDNYWVAISDPGSGVYRNATPDRMADPDRFYLPTLKVEYELGKVRLISNTSYYNRLERVNGYSGTIYNLSYFQQFLAPKPFNSQYGRPTDPRGRACGPCELLYPLLTPTGLNLPGLPDYTSSALITNRQANFTQEVRVQSADPNARLTWVAGIFYGRNTQRSIEEIRDPQLPQLTQLLWGETVKQAWGEDLLANGDDYINDTTGHDRQTALFIDATLGITDKLKVTAGARYAWTHFDFDNLNDGPQDLLLNKGVPATVAGSKDEKPFTPKLGVSYQITGDDLVYATVAKGYRIGGATPPLPAAACGEGFPTSYNSDSVWSYEVGSKDRFFDRKLQVAASAFYIQWKNIQQAFYVPACGIQFTTNAGDAVSKGFDVQAQWQVTRGLDLEMSAGYTDAKFTTDSLDAAGDVLNLEGDALDVAPWSVTLAAQYVFPALGHEAFARVDYEFNSRRTAPIPNEDPRSAFFDPGLIADPPTHIVSARAGINLGKVDVALYVNNLLNAHPQLNLQHQDQDTTLFEAQTLRPRTVGISASFRY